PSVPTRRSSDLKGPVQAAGTDRRLDHVVRLAVLVLLITEWRGEHHQPPHTALLNGGECLFHVLRVSEEVHAVDAVQSFAHTHRITEVPLGELRWRIQNSPTTTLSRVYT